MPFFLCVLYFPFAVAITTGNTCVSSNYIHWSICSHYFSRRRRGLLFFSRTSPLVASKCETCYDMLAERRGRFDTKLPSRRKKPPNAS